MKTCTVCKEQKALDEFYNYKTSKDGKCYRCKTCDNIARQRWAEKNPEKAKKSRRGRSLKFKYGISLEEYDLIVTGKHLPSLLVL